MWCFLVLLVCFWLSNTKPFEFSVWPNTTPDLPLVRRYFQIIPKDTYNATEVKLKVEHLSKDHTEVIETEFVKLYAPFVHPFQKYYGYIYSQTQDAACCFPEYFRASLWTYDETFELEEASGVHTVYWDYRFLNSKYSFEMKELGPGEVKVLPVAKSGEQLHKQARIFVYNTRKATALGQMDWKVEQWTSESSALHWVAEKPQVLYWGMKAYNGFGNGKTLGAGFFTEDFYFCIVFCELGADCPEVAQEYKETGNPVFYAPAIPNRVQFPIRKKKVKVIEGAPLWIPMPVNPAEVHIEIKFSKSLKIDEKYYDPYFFKEIQKDGSTYVFTRERDYWPGYSHFPFTFSFDTDIRYGKSVKIRIKMKGDSYESKWQEIEVTPTQVGELETKPEKWTTMYTWSNLDNFKDVGQYANLGFNTIPLHGVVHSSNWHLENLYGEYFVPKRYEWDDGLKFGVQVSMFHHSNPSINMYDLFSQVLKVSSIDAAKVPSDTENRQSELDMWQNAVDFYSATGMTDYGYNGWFYQKHLSKFANLCEMMQPDFIEIDIEGYTYSYSFSEEDIALSLNMQNRKLAGETNEELMERITDEILSDVVNACALKSNGTKFAHAQVDCYGNKGWQLGKWEKYAKAGIICNPKSFWELKDPSTLALMLHSSRLGLLATPSSSSDIFLGSTHGCWGEYESWMTFEWVVHSLLSQATGFMIRYAYYFIDDHADFLYFREAIEVLAPFEDRILTGEVALYDFSDVDNVAISAVKSEGEYIIAVSPIVVTSGVDRFTGGGFTFEFFTDTDGKYVEFIDLRTKKRVRKSDWFMSYKTKINKNVIEVTWESGYATVLLVTTAKEKYVGAVTAFLIVSSMSIVGFFVALVILLLFSFAFRATKANRK